ncbi:hypothetical protein JCM3775_005263 [Rhodotorula graminis]
MADPPKLASAVTDYARLDPVNLAASPIPLKLAHGVVNRDYRLIELVKALADTLTSDDDARRARGVSLLSAVVIKLVDLDGAALDRQITKTLTTFFVDKLGENNSLVACADALTALTASAAFGVGEGMEVAQGVFTSVTLKAHPQAVRHSVYVLVDALMGRSRPALLRLGNEFISGYCALVEGEKDPRNLMISFGIVRVILLEFDIAKNVEDLFDITFCYFPITFTPPPDDPYGISSDDLIVALRDCLSATPLFGRLALPLFYDKMQAASEKAKRQTLQALTACFPIYGAAASGEWAGRFSEALIIEVFHASDDSMQDLALGTMRALFATLYPDETLDGSGAAVAQPVAPEGEDAEMQPVSELVVESAAAAPEDKIEGVAVKVVQNSLDELAEPEKNNAKPAVRILTALVASSARLARYVLAQALPPLLALYKDQDQITLRPSVLSHLATLLSSLSPPEPSPSPSAVTLPTILFPPPSLLSHDTNGSSPSPLDPFRDDLLSLLPSATRALTCRLAALSALSALLRVPHFLSADEREYCVSAMNDVLATPLDGDEYYDAALDALVLVAASHPSLVERLVLPGLFAALPAGAPGSSSPSHAEAGRDAYRRALEALAALAVCHPALFELVAVRLSARLEALVALPADGDEGPPAALYAHHVLTTLRAVLADKVRRGDADVPKYVERFVPGLLGMFLLPTTVEREAGRGKTVAEDVRLLVDAGKVVNLVLQRVDVERQSAFSAAVNDAFHRGKLEALLGAAAVKEAGAVPFAPFSSSSSTSQQNLLSLFTSCLVAMRPTVSLPTADLVTFLRSCLERSLACQNEIQLVAVLHLLANSVNKRAQDVPDFIEQDLPAFFDAHVAPSSSPGVTRRTALRVWIWVAKGLIVRSDARGYAMVERVLALFRDETLGRTAAASLGAIAEEKDGVLAKDNFAVIRLLYKQRFFTFLLPKLVASYKEASGPGQTVYLAALSSLLQHLPKQLALTQLPKLVPLLITSLDLPDAALRANVLDALSTLVAEVPAELDNAISGIVAKVLRGLSGETATAQGRAAVHLRLSSLAFLSVLPAHIPYLSLHGQKATVLKELGRAIDDPRRDVRRAAVDARSRWFLYSG